VDMFVTRKGARVAFTFAVISAVVASCITVYGLAAGFSAFEGVFLGVGCMIVLWAIIFSFFEVQRIARRSKRISGNASGIDPDAPRVVIVEPPTGHPYPHHETHDGSPGLDQGQLTTQSPDMSPFSELFHWRRKQKPS
jgi:hypothetical protein